MAITPTSWGKKVQITEIATSAVTVSGYVGLITADNLPSEIWSLAENGGGDLRICLNSDGTNQIPIDAALFDTTGQVATIWFRLPFFSSGLSVWLFYDKAGETQPAVTDPFGRNAVWQDFIAVIHQGTFIDSAGNHNPVLNGSPTLVASQWGGQGYNLANDTQYISIPDSTSLDLDTRAYLQAWLNADDTLNGMTVASKSVSNGNGWRMFKRVGSPEPRFRHPNLSPDNLDGASNVFGLSRNGFYWDGTNRSIYVNDSQVASDTTSGTITNNNDDVTLGSLHGSTGDIEGVLGEVWISDTLTFDADKESTEYSNQSSPATFWSTGAPESTGGGTTVVAEIKDNSFQLASHINFLVSTLSNKTLSYQDYLSIVKPLQSAILRERQSEAKGRSSLANITSTNLRESQLSSYVNTSSTTVDSNLINKSLQNGLLNLSLLNIADSNIYELSLQQDSSISQITLSQSFSDKQYQNSSSEVFLKVFSDYSNRDVQFEVDSSSYSTSIEASSEDYSVSLNEIKNTSQVSSKILDKNLQSTSSQVFYNLVEGIGIGTIKISVLGGSKVVLNPLTDFNLTIK